MSPLKAYYHLTKPGIVYGNGITTLAGFLFGASLMKHFSFKAFAGVMIGSSLVIACGCVINNYIDKDIDRVMSRTKKRPIVTGLIAQRSAILFGIILGVVGFILLAVWTYKPTVVAGAVGLFFYLVMYSIWKRRAPIGTVIGSVSGATPILAGYTAATDRLNAAAIILFLTMVIWQMPHFYAIAMYRFEDYKRAGLPVLPVKHGMRRTRLEIIIYMVAFIIIAVALTAYGYAGYSYAIVMAAVGLFWLRKGVAGFKSRDDATFGKDMFLLSLIVLLVFSAMVATGALLP